jgi:uncharacterized membrane protein YccC
VRALAVFPLPREQIQQIFLRDGHQEGELIHTRRDGTEVIVASHRLFFPDGCIKYLHVVAHATNDPPNHKQFLGAVMDVMQAKQPEEQLRYAQSELERVSRVTAYIRTWP